MRFGLRSARYTLGRRRRSHEIEDGRAEGLIAGVDGIHLSEVIVTANDLQPRREPMYRDQSGEQLARLHLHLHQIEFCIGDEQRG